jgi:L-rhamnose mutarotase
MKCFAQALDLQDDPQLIREYEVHHQRVWPEVIEALRGIGIWRMKIFRLGSRLFMYAEAGDDFDPTRDYQSYTNNPRCREWDVLMRRYQRTAPGARPGEWWASMQEVFDLESAPGVGLPTRNTP